MARICWITDPHLNFLPAPDSSREFGAALRSEVEFDAVVITGDIAEAPNVAPLLKLFAQGVDKPVYFVLGNHDYYRGSFAEVREEMSKLVTHPTLLWLDRAEPVLLDESTALVGHQGWFDGRYGNALKSRVVMSDFEYIKDLRSEYNALAWGYYEGGRDPLLAKLREVSAQAASEAKVSLLKALALRKTVVFATHFPPFAGACWHQGSLSDAHWMPWFTSAAMGDMLDEVAADHPDHRIVVLCGHTHSSGRHQQAANLLVLTGKSKYGAPDYTGIIETPIAPDFTDVLQTPIPNF